MNRPIRFILNNTTVETSLHPGTVVLDFLRRDRRLTGTKEGCREGDCGACAVLLGTLDGEGEAVRYRAVNSCLLPLADVQGKHLVSIEGLNLTRRREDAAPLPLTPVQQQFVDHGAVQCGFCTPGFVVSLSGYLLDQKAWSYEGALDAVAGNICRCTGYASIKRAIGGLLDRLARLRGGRADTQRRADGQSRAGTQSGAGGKGGSGPSGPDHLRALAAFGVVPEYFVAIPGRLRELEAQGLRDLGEGGSGRPGQGQGAGPTQSRTVVAGGTDLFVQKPERLLAGRPHFLFDDPELRGVRVEGDRLYLGAGIPMEEVRGIPELKERIPGLVEALSLIASAPIRNRATLGGNIVNASPIGDFTVMLLALGAVVGLGDGSGARQVELSRLFRGYKQLDLGPGELLKWIILPLEQGLFSFEKVARRRHLDIASVNSAAWLSLREGRIAKARLAAGGVAPIPLYLAQASACLEGRQPSEELLEQSLLQAQEEISPIDDVRGSERYKRLLLRQLLLAHFHRFFPQLMRAEVWV